MSTIALALGVIAILVAGLTHMLDQSLPYRIDPSQYLQYLWVGRLSMVSLVTSIATILFSVASRRPLPFFLGLSSLALLLLFTGGVHSGPSPKIWCVINLHHIETAKQQLAQEIGLSNGAVVTAEQILSYANGAGSSLRCAEGGHYIIGAVGAEPRCSLHGSRSEIEAGWRLENLKYSGQTGSVVLGTNSSK